MKKIFLIFSTILICASNIFATNLASQHEKTTVAYEWVDDLPDLDTLDSGVFCHTPGFFNSHWGDDFTTVSKSDKNLSRLEPVTSENGGKVYSYDSFDFTPHSMYYYFSKDDQLWGVDIGCKYSSGIQVPDVLDILYKLESKYGNFYPITQESQISDDWDSYYYLTECNLSDTISVRFAVSFDFNCIAVDVIFINWSFMDDNFVDEKIYYDDSYAPYSSKTITPDDYQDGKVLNIYSWNDEFKTRIADYYPGYDKSTDMIGDVKVNWIITPNADNAYLMKLDQALLLTPTEKPNNRVDIFLVESDYILKYTDTPYTMDLTKLGLTNGDLKKQFTYTKDIGMAKGKQKSLTWQCCPGGLIYRRSIAKEVLGTDEPDKVQKALSTWEKFDEVARKAKSKGYKMISGPNDNFKIFSDNAKNPWIVNEKISVPSSMKNWLAQQKLYMEKGYSNNAVMWSWEQWEGLKKDGKVMCYFGPDWFIDFCLAPMSDMENGSYGDWAFCKGPEGFTWGGSWICVAEGCDNKDLARDIIYKLTCDEKIMERIAIETGDFVNNENVMSKLSKSKTGNPFLGGQNHKKFMVDIAKSLDFSAEMSPYTTIINERFQIVMQDYINGLVDEKTAWENFYNAIQEIYPNLVR